MAPVRMSASMPLGIAPLCCRAYGKIVYSSRTRSRSVSTAPLTRATGFATICGAALGCGVAAVGACELTSCAETGLMAASSRIEIENWCFMIFLRKIRGGNFPPPGLTSNRLGGRDVHYAVRLVRLAAVAIAAELRRVVAAGLRNIVAANEEARREVAVGVGEHGHAVLVVAGRAGHCRHSRAEGCQFAIGANPERSGIVLQELRRVGAGHRDRCGSAAGAIPVVFAAASNGCAAAHWVVVLIHVGRARAIGAEQGGSVAADYRQGFNGYAFHHSDFGQVAVMAAQAKEDDGVGVVRAGDGALRRQGNRIGRLAVAAEYSCLAVEGIEFLSPQSKFASL